MGNFDFVYNLKLADKSKLPSFKRELLEMDSRLLHCGIIEAYLDEDDVNPTGHFYIPCKEFILFSGIDAGSVGHQMAHFVEMGNLDRLKVGDFGFGKVVDNQRRMDESKGPYFIAAFLREMRVRAIQLHIDDKAYHTPLSHQYFSIYSRRKTTKNNSILDHVYFGDVTKFIPFGRFKDVNSFEEFVYEQEEKIYNAWSKERIRHEWVKRLNYIRDWMETKEEKLAALCLIFFILCMQILVSSMMMDQNQKILM